MYFGSAPFQTRLLEDNALMIDPKLLHGTLYSLVIDGAILD